MKNIYKILAAGAFVVPVLAGAQAGTIPGLLATFTSLINAVIPVIIALAGLVFLWGVFKFITAAGDEKARDAGRQYIIWGLVGLVIMFAFWGLVRILITTFGLQTGPSGLTPPTL
ncbi:MAG: hypothetical protein HYT22_00260 [Candidatus Niyogibacteria bacterium]|nr:hypothetical protein [Candidatus Niyogibacteria bacterium]